MRYAGLRVNGYVSPTSTSDDELDDAVAASYEDDAWRRSICALARAPIDDLVRAHTTQFAAG